MKDKKALDLKINNKKSQHFLFTGSCIDILKTVHANSISVIFTDPPYNASLNYGAGYNDHMPWKDYYTQARKWFTEYKRILNDQGSVYLMNYPEINARLLPILEDELGLTFQRWITWHYPTNIGHSKKNFTRSQRSILFLTKTKDYIFNKEYILQPYKNPTDGKVKDRIDRGFKGRGAYDALNYFDLLEMRMVEQNRRISDYQEIDLLKNVSVDRMKQKHPCQLPLELIERFIRVSSNPGGVIMDPFAGTFTTSLAAARHGRNSIGIEINPKYVTLGKKRLLAAAKG
jgi:DNA modification methylase